MVNRFFVGALALGCAACGPLLGVGGEESSNPAPDGTVDDAGVRPGDPADAATTDGSGNESCSVPCGGGVCLGGVCQPWVVGTSGVGDILGVATDGQKIFVTVEGDDAIRALPNAMGSAQTASTLLVESSPMQIEIVDGSLTWVNREPDVGAGIGPLIYRSNPDGTARAFAFAPGIGVRSFAKYAEGDWFYGFAVNAAEIWRKHTINEQHIASIPPVRFLALDSAKAFIFWSGPKGIHKTAATTKTNAAIGVSSTAAIGLAIAEPWVYFTTESGQLRRVALNGNSESVMGSAPTPPSAVGDVALSPDGRWAYWGAGHDVLGLRLPVP